MLCGVDFVGYRERPCVGRLPAGVATSMALSGYIASPPSSSEQFAALLEAGIPSGGSGHRGPAVHESRRDGQAEAVIEACILGRPMASPPSAPLQDGESGARSRWRSSSNIGARLAAPGVDIPRPSSGASWSDERRSPWPPPRGLGWRPW